MNRSDLLNHRREPKKLYGRPEFIPVKKAKLPGALGRIRSKRVEATKMTAVSAEHSIAFWWKNGDILSDTAFYALFVKNLPGNRFFPLFEFHWHPSHKGFHCKTPCGSPLDYTDRMLPGAVEVDLKTDPMCDPRKPSDRDKLVCLVCRACGIMVDDPDNELQGKLWSQ